MLELKHPYEKWMWVTWVITAIAAVAALLMLWMRSAGMERSLWTPLAFSIPLLLISVVTLPVLYFYGRSALKGMRELVLEGQPWAHWRYSQDEWQRFAESEWTRFRLPRRRQALARTLSSTSRAATTVLAWISTVSATLSA